MGKYEQECEYEVVCVSMCKSVSKKMMWMMVSACISKNVSMHMAISLIVNPRKSLIIMNKRGYNFKCYFEFKKYDGYMN